MSTASLDDSQLAVLDLPPSTSATVFGSAGTGKTTTITELVARRVIDEGMRSDELVVIAGSRAAATTLRDRLAQRLGTMTIGPLARTMASLAHAVLLREALASGAPRPLLITGAEQDAIVQELLDGHLAFGGGPEWPEHLGNEVRMQPGFRQQLRDVFARASELGISAAELAALDPSRAEWVAAGAVMAEYEQVIALERRTDLAVLDASRLLHEGARAIEAGVVPELRLVIVDDGQELTPGAVRMLEALGSQGATIVAFGDPDTSTGTFRGADPRLLAELETRVASGHEATRPDGAGSQRDWRRMQLAVDHRHGEELSTMLHERLGAIGAALSVSHRATAVAAHARDAGLPDGGSAIRAFRVASAAEEAAAIAGVLRRRHVLDGVPWNEMAVVVRTQRMARQLTQWLASFEVPTAAEGATSLRRSRVVLDLMLMLRIATGRETLTAAFAETLLTSPLVGVDAVGARRLRRALRHRALLEQDAQPEPAAVLLAAALLEPAGLVDIPGREAHAARRLAAALERGKAAADPKDPSTPDEVLWELWDALGVADAWRSLALGGGVDGVDANRRLDAVVALFEQANRFAERHPDANAGAFVDAWATAALDDDSLAAKAAFEIVHLGTPSAFISREFDTVVVAGLQEGVWPNLRLRGSLLGASDIASRGNQRVEDVLHDELRLFQQAASRARSLLVLTAIESDDAVPSQLFVGAERAERPSARLFTLRSLVGELRARLFDDADPAAAAALARLAAAGVPGAASSQWAGLSAISSDAPIGTIDGLPPSVSPSAIATFEECALDWVAQRLSGGSASQAASIGTIVHGAVESAAPTKEALLEAVEARWGELGFLASWESLREHRVVEGMVEVIAEYFAELEQSGWVVESGDHEHRFSLDLGDAVLRGSIDWIERQGDRVRIVDLKTGKHGPSRQETAAHPQLQAYQLAVDRGAIDGLPDGAQSAGARLLYPKVSKPTFEQAPLDAEALSAFAELVVDVAHGMASSSFAAHPHAHCLQQGWHSCTLHVKKQVSE